MEHLTVRRHTTFDELLAFRREWEALHRQAEGTVFQFPEWLALWWSLYGAGLEFRGFSFWAGNRLAALFPCFRHTLRRGPFRFTRLRLLGEHEVYGEYAPLVHPEDADAAVGAAADVLSEELARPGLDCLDFNSLPDRSPFIALLLDRLRQRGLRTRFDPQSLDRMTLELPPDVGTYLRNLPRRFRSHLNRSERLLFQSGAVHRCGNGGRNGDYEAWLECLHEKGWSRKNRDKGYFLERKRFREFMRGIVGLLPPENVRMHMILADDQPLAATLAFVMNGHYHEYVGGFDPDHPLSKYGPGKVLSSLCIREAIGKGCRRFDLQGGRERYKLEVGCRLTGYGRATVFSRGRWNPKPLLFWAAIRVLKLKRQLKARRGAGGH